LSESRRCVALHRKLRRKRQRTQNKFKHTVPQPPAFPRFYSAFNDIAYQDQRKASSNKYLSLSVSSVQGSVSHHPSDVSPRSKKQADVATQHNPLVLAGLLGCMASGVGMQAANRVCCCIGIIVGLIRLNSWGKPPQKDRSNFGLPHPRLLGWQPLQM
jgi:hypothetical protein